MSVTPSEFKAVFSDKKWSEDFLRFLEVIFHLYPEKKFHQLLASVSETEQTDESIYKKVQSGLPGIKPFLSELTYALPSLRTQKKEMSREMLEIIGSKTTVDGYLEIGSTGRYISDLRKHLRLTGTIYLTNDIAPSNAPSDLFERGQIKKIGRFFPLDYKPIATGIIPDASVDLVTCLIGLHHCPPVQLDGYLKSIRRILRPGGLFIIRDHDVKSEAMGQFVSLVHTVFNLGLKVPWETNQLEFKRFQPVESLSAVIVAAGFRDLGFRILQDRDPSLNTLMGFEKTDR